MEGAYNESIEIELKPLDTTVSITSTSSTTTVAAAVTETKPPSESNSTGVSLLIGNANARPFEKAVKTSDNSLKCLRLKYFFVRLKLIKI